MKLNLNGKARRKEFEEDWLFAVESHQFKPYMTDNNFKYTWFLFLPSAAVHLENINRCDMLLQLEYRSTLINTTLTYT